MNAEPGWYDAGTPGRLRWWDGVQWTAHEAPVPAPPAVTAPVSAAPAVAAPASVPAAWPLPGPGWYPTPAGPLRWWEGRKWTGFRIKQGRPGTDWASAEQPVLAWVFGGLFAALAALQFTLGALTGSVSIAGIGMLVLAALWFGIAVQSQAVQRIPVPAGAAVAPEVIRPLPREQEGAGAGWYPVARKTTRWWTGARWSQYVGTALGIRPTFHGARALRILLAMAWTVLGFGVLGALVGIVFVAADGDGTVLFIGVMFIIGGALVAVLGLVLLLLTRFQRRILLLPADPPRT
ncbi:DUF2510 domain-containing protein [Herbiconiux sp.]|uniref:DUF2510 domain-containing protein n=1 Tax=Herbiconiux sp. TaxID=1871186 RepID=UPI0025C480D4|nr:DUF2510 domain-containing protein [Herbiconiux sp.]